MFEMKRNFFVTEFAFTNLIYLISEGSTCELTSNNPSQKTSIRQYQMAEVNLHHPSARKLWKPTRTVDEVMGVKSDLKTWLIWCWTVDEVEYRQIQLIDTQD